MATPPYSLTILVNVPPPLARSSMRQPSEIDIWLFYMMAPMSLAACSKAWAPIYFVSA